MDLFTDFFINQTEYPDPEFFFEHTDNTICSNVSIKTIENYLNYIKILKMYVIPKGQPELQSRERLKVLESHMIDKIMLSAIGDDIILLGKRNGKYWYIYLDQNVNKCEVGKFTSNLPEATILESFESFGKFLSNSESNSKLIEVNQKLYTNWLVF